MSQAVSPARFNQKKRIAVLWIISIAFAIVMLLGQPEISEGGYSHEIIENVGLALVLAAVFGRLWSILYIGAKKNNELVVLGPYSMTRNPLYFFSIIGLVGIGLIYGSILGTAVLLAVSSAVFGYTALREAATLRVLFGPAYDVYARRTPLLLPRPSLYRSDSEVTFSVKALVRTFLDCLPFLLLYPLIELIELLRTQGVLKALFYLP